MELVFIIIGLILGGLIAFLWAKQKFSHPNFNAADLELLKNENKTLEILKSWGYGIIGIVVILSIFSGFKYPWKWIDALYVTENEKIEIIRENWDSAYYPLIEWCAKKSDLDKFDLIRLKM